MISDLEIINRLFASYTFEPNNHFERKEEILPMKTRVMRI